MGQRTGHIVAAAMVLLATFALAPGTARSSGPPGAPPPPTTVTLVTGDRVTLRTVGGQVSPRIERGEGRDDVTFSVHTVGERIEVIPSDAVALLAAGKLDRRLFDVAALQRMGYGDADRPDVPLIVQDEGRGRRVRPATVEEAGAEATALPAASATGVRQPKDRAVDFWNAITRGGTERSLEGGIGKVWLDGIARTSLDVSVPHIGAPSAWAAGFTGAGVKVAVIDTGVDETHPDLAGKVAESRDFTGSGDDDVVGHGTHVASTIVGSGAASGGRNQGVAPDATLLDAKVCEEFGCQESAILAGMQWAAESGAAIANLSLGGHDTPEIDPLEAAVAHLTDQYGTLFVVAAGNSGPRPGSVGSPASADAALAVGAVDDADRPAEFSSRGPRAGDAAIKPDVSAPGVDITAARSTTSSGTGPYVSMEGTSMAAPHVAGAAALLRQQHPGWTGAQVKALLMGSAQPDAAVDVFAQGAGRVDLARAVTSRPTPSRPASRWARSYGPTTTTRSRPGRSPTATPAPSRSRWTSPSRRRALRPACSPSPPIR